MYNKLLLYTAVLRPILTYGSPVWGYAADSNIKILECVCVPLTNHSSAIQTHQDISAETVSKNNSVPVTPPSCHVRSTNQDTLYQAGPITSGHIYKLDMGWRNASRSVSQRRPASILAIQKFLRAGRRSAMGFKEKDQMVSVAIAEGRVLHARIRFS
ncbi:hypothetical protein TNCV_3522811 [Trichonephila clavipes]|uniref:Uncharacterized protein n=1 Tax=Trichonephila clavipes TaxID=2585209 RepID=A0A8X6W8V2_TRICX|nr:hypothetical protein TNCV_3522811 [Trichonephila clavipes]